MNRYPVWKYVIIVIALVVGGLYALPNFFGESPAVQVSSVKPLIKIDTGTLSQVESALKAAGITPDLVTLEGTSVKVRLADTDTQLKAKDAIQRALVPDASNPGYVVALNLLSSSPAWLTSLHASPMYLGLDLRGGVHFMLQVDMQAALTKRAESLSGDLRTSLREKISGTVALPATPKPSKCAFGMPPRWTRPRPFSRTSLPTCKRSMSPRAPSSS